VRGRVTICSMLTLLTAALPDVCLVCNLQCLQPIRICFQPSVDFIHTECLDVVRLANTWQSC
jgi:hypothetical protein